MIEYPEIEEGNPAPSWYRSDVAPLGEGMRNETGEDADY